MRSEGVRERGVRREFEGRTAGFFLYQRLIIELRCRVINIGKLENC